MTYLQHIHPPCVLHEQYMQVGGGKFSVVLGAIIMLPKMHDVSEI